MLQHHLKWIIRRLSRQKTTTALHITGLTVGLTACLLIGLFLRHELTYDSRHRKADRIYRINSVFSNNGDLSHHYSTPMPLAEVLRREVPGLETVAQWHPLPKNQSLIVTEKKERFYQEHIMLAEPELLDVFDIKILEGDAKQSLSQPFQALLTPETAQRIFGTAQVAGKTFQLRDAYTITVAGLFEPLPANSHLQTNMILSFHRDPAFLSNFPDSWDFISGTSTYVVLPEGKDPAALEAPLKALADRYQNNHPERPAGIRSDFTVQPLRSIHFDERYGSAWVPAVRTDWLWIFGIIGLAVLVLACINFVNLSTAQALVRAREVGVRKSIGAGQMQLIGQFLGEALLLTLVSGLAALAIVQVILPVINRLLDLQITLNWLQSPVLLLSALGFCLLTGLAAGWYPAWLTSGFNPVAAMKGKQRTGAAPLRKGLVVFQFSISIALMMALGMMWQQVRLLHNQSLGFNQEHIVNIPIPWQGSIQDKMLLESHLRKLPEVRDLSFSTSSPSDEGHRGALMSHSGRDDAARQEITLIMADAHFAPMYELNLLAGRFPEATDSIRSTVPLEQQTIRVLVNEHCARLLGFTAPADAVGRQFWMGYNDGAAEITGVVADFNSGPLQQAIPPLAVLTDQNFRGQAGIKIRANANLPQALSDIQGAWEQVYPQGVFEYAFLDEQIDHYYRAENRLFALFSAFTALALLISCMGLWGLATFAAQQRTKEIGIRKVLGAGAAQLTIMLSGGFLKLVGIAFVAALPVAYGGIQYWLQGYAFRVHTQWWVFALAGAGAMLIAFVTISFQSIRAALANPVETLRSE